MLKAFQKKKTNGSLEKMRVSFDLDEVLFVNPATHQTERPLPAPLRIIFKERLRLGTPDVIHSLQDLGYEVWVYTSSFRSEKYIRTLFGLYGVHFDGIVNGNRHLKEVQKGHKETLPQKIPSRYHISLHIDDEAVICSYGRSYGFDTYQLDTPDAEWKEKVVQRAEQVKKKLAAQRAMREKAKQEQ